MRPSLLAASNLLTFACALGAVACSGADGGAQPFEAPSGGGLDAALDAGADGGGLDANGAPLDAKSDSGNRCGKTLTGVLRDFKDSHPDFEHVLGDDPGIVQVDLGADGKPVYAGSDGNPTTTTKEAFDQWFRDVPGVNHPLPFSITLEKGATGVYTFASSAFFPLDGKGFGNEGREHNYHFTYELRTTFQYTGGETFEFTGDDDLFVFVNKKLAIDLGGVHGAMSGTIDLDAKATELGLEKGKVYPLDFFFAERHTTESNFRIDTTLDFVDCGGTIK